MKFRTKALVAVAVAALGAASAFAQSSGIQGSGLYIGGSVGSSHWKGGDLSGTANDKSDTGGKVYAGYSFTPNIALEFGYVDLGKFTGPAGDAKASGYFLDAVGTVPLGYNISALARLGAVNGKMETSGSGVSDPGRSTELKGGLGLQYDFNPNLAIRTEWERYRFDTIGGKDNADLYSVGLNYKF